MHSERIKEFLKYASPRLDYIEHCMEKKATRILKFLRRSANSKKLVKKRLDDTLDIQRELGMNTNLKTPWVNDVVSSNTMAGLIPNYANAVLALTKKGYTPKQAQRIVEKARLRTLATDNYIHGVDMYPNMAERLHISNTFWKPEATKRLYDMSPTPPPVARSHNAIVPYVHDAEVVESAIRAPKSKSTELALLDGMVSPGGRTMRQTRGEVIPPKQVPADPKTIPSDWRQLGDSYNTSVRQLDELKKGKSSKAPANKGGAPKADADNAKGWWDDFYKGVGTWAKEHPVLTPAITAGVAAPLAGGIGYGIGHDSGFESGSSSATAYWQMREALRNHQLRGVNSEFLTRLANLFGGGDLSRLIG